MTELRKPDDSTSGQRGDAARYAFEALVRSKFSCLTGRQVYVLFLLCQDGGRHTVRGLAAKLGVSRPVISRAIDTIETIGFAQRQKNPDDRRDVFLVPTAEAFEFVRTLLEAAKAA